MKKLILSFILFAIPIMAQETVTTYSDLAGTPGWEFEDEATVYVTARVGTTTGGFIIGTVATSGNGILIIFDDDDNDGTYTASFSISKTRPSVDFETLHILGSEWATITVDLDNNTIFGTATIRAIGRATILTYYDTQKANQATQFANGETVYIFASVNPTLIKGSIVSGTASSPYGFQKITFNDTDSDGTYTAKFVVYKGEGSPTFSMVIAVDLKPGTTKVGTKTIMVVERTRAVVKTYNSDVVESTTFGDGKPVVAKAWLDYASESPVYGIATNLTSKGTISLKFDSQAQGTYTTQFKVSKTAGEGILLAADGEQIKIEADLARDGRMGSATVKADYTPPAVSVSASLNIFSPYTSMGEKDTATIWLNSSENGSCVINVSGKEIGRCGISASTPTPFVWDGYYYNPDTERYETFIPGKYSVDVTFSDKAGNTGQGSCSVTIDSTAPVVTYFCSPLVFSPHTSLGYNDSVYLWFYSDGPGRYSVTVDGLIPSGSYEGGLVGSTSSFCGSYIWNGEYAIGSATEGEHTVRVKVSDNAGNWNDKSYTITLDRTQPRIDSLTENTGSQTFYRDENILFTMRASDWIDITQTRDVRKGEAIVDLNGSETRLAYVGDSLFQGYYTVVEGDTGSFSVSGEFRDEAGNPAINYGTITGTIYVDGSKVRPTVGSRIARIGLIEPKVEQPALSVPTIKGSTTDSLSINWNETIDDGQRVKVTDQNRKHIWVASYNKGSLSATLDNSYLYYGNPVSDYRNITVGSAYALKKKAKKNDEIVLSLVALKIDAELSYPTLAGSETSLVVKHPEIMIGELICVANSTNCWLGTATSNGSFTISSKNLYSGAMLANYLNLNLSNLTVEKVGWATGGDAVIDIGEVRRVSLSDDGVDGIGILAGDVIVGDGMYSGVYTLMEGDDTENAQLKGHFVYNRKKAKNDPYADTRLKVSIDSTPPVIANNSASPIPFNPYLTNCEIKYNLSEKSWVKVKICDIYDNPIKIIASPETFYGENVKTIWDGRTSAGVIPEDGIYYYYIDAEDEAGNTAISKKGAIILSSIEIKVKEIDITPNPFQPTHKPGQTDDKPSADTTLWFKVALESSEDGTPVTDAQLLNLGFDFNHDYRMYDETNGWAWFNYPYGLLYPKVFDKDSKEIEIKGFPDYDLCNPRDDDPWPGGWPYPVELGKQAYKDVGDGNVSNDYSVLCCFRKETDGNYYAYWGVEMWDWNLAPGPYVVRVDSRLTGIWWQFTVDESKKEEKLHALPLYEEGYGLRSDVFEVAMNIEEAPPPVQPDNQAPTIIATYPAQGEEIKKGSITEVWADLVDNEGGSGVNLDASEIYLVNKDEQRIGGYQTNDGNSKIYWKLGTPDAPLYLDTNSPGSYTIKVKPVDRQGNGKEAEYQEIVFSIKDIVPPDISNPDPINDAVRYSPFDDTIYVTVSEIGCGESGIDTSLTTLTLTGPEQATLTTIYLESGPNSGRLKAELATPLTVDGTYTIKVTAYDTVGNKSSASFSFYLKTPRPVVTILYPTSGASFYSPYTGTISTKIYQEDQVAGYEIDWATSTLSLFDPNNSQVGIVDNGTSIRGDFEGTLTYRLATGSLTADGDCQIKVSAVNKKGYSASSTSTFSVRAVKPTIGSPYPTVLYLKQPYTGSVSVKIEVDYDNQIDTSSLFLSLKRLPNENIPLGTITYIGGTKSGTLYGTPTNPLVAPGIYEIRAEAKDKAGNSTSQNFQFNLTWYLPSVSGSLSYPLFSPYTSTGVRDTVTITFSCDEDSTYTVTVDDRSLKNAGGTLSAGSLTSYIWDDGRDQSNGTFTEGSHTMKVTCENMVAGMGEKTLIITIDNTSPEIKSLALSDYIFSPGTSAGSEDTTKISFTIGTESATYTITVDGKTPTGIGSATGFLLGNKSAEFTWDGSHTLGTFSDGAYIVEVIVTDSAGNSYSTSTLVTIDRTCPMIGTITNNTGGRCFCKDKVVVLILYADTDVQTGTIYLSGKEIRLQRISAGIFSGSYKVTDGDLGVLEIRGSIIDSAGNPNPNPSKVFGTITVDGSTPPNQNIFTRIIRIGALPAKEERRDLQYAQTNTTESITIDCSGENLKQGQRVKVSDSSSDHIWVVAIANNKATLDNSSLYYGLPVPDYRNITVGTAIALKTVAKGGDGIVFSISCVEIQDTDVLSGVIKNQTTGSLTLSDSNIKIGERILVGAGSNFWFGLATVAGSFTISNANLYSGPIVSDYRVLSISTCEKVSFAVGGYANSDIGSIIKGFGLSDAGLCGDLRPGDGVYSALYTIKNGDDGQGVPVYGHFLYNKQKATNDGYTDSRIMVSMDGTPPKVTSIGAQPSPFNPYLTNLKISYSLSEKSYIVIEICNKNSELVKRLVPPDPQQGENVDTYWDGSDNMGNRVTDGSYYYTIKAEDDAGNLYISEEGEVKVTSLKIEVESFNISPDPFFINKPDKDGIYFTVKFKITLKSSIQGGVTKQQLENLGFDFEQSSGHLNYPYGLLSFDIYDPQGNKLEHSSKYPDMTAGVDIDPWLNILLPTGLPNRPNYGDYDPNTPSECEGDGDKENDYGNLIAFLKDSDGNYYTEYEYAERGWSNPKGIYTHRLSAELVSLGWKSVVCGKWHAEPHYWGHYGLRSDVYDRKFEAKEDPPVPPQDTTPPSVSATDPIAGTVKKQSEVLRVSAALIDNQGGVGVNISDSEIRLFDSSNTLVPGSQTNNGLDTIYWGLEAALSTPGSYTIKITAVDKKSNAGSYTFNFTVKDKTPPKVTQTSPVNNEIVSAPFSGPILVFVSDEDTGKSAIDWTKTTMGIKKGDTTHTCNCSYATETVNYKGYLTGTPVPGLTASGTYTVTVWVYDVEGNGTSSWFNFVIPEQIVVTGPDGNTLEIPYDTEITFPTKGTVGSGTVRMGTESDPGGHSGLKVVGKVISFYYGTISLFGAKFTKDIKLTLCYTDKDLDGADEQKLYIYEKDGGWIKVGGTVDKNTNKVTYTIPANTPIKEMYAIMSPIPEGQKVLSANDIYAAPNPTKGFTKFFFPDDAGDVKVEVYTLSGDLVWENTGKGGSGHNSIEWPCTNKAGRKVGTGLYIYKVTIEYASGKKEEVIKKLVVIKQ